MQYVGSKNRFAKELIPILQNYIDENNIETYIEPFVGGANVIDKINCKNKFGYDENKYLIALLEYVSLQKQLPTTITEDEYNNVKNNKSKYNDWYVGLVGFCATFGCKFFGGYARVRKTKRDVPSGAIRNIKKQQPNLKDINFVCKKFQELDISNIKNCLIYCDPPYKGTTKYKTDPFPYEEYYDFVRKLSKNNIVLCSEYNMPNDFECVWEKKTITNFSDKRKNASERTEKLFVLK